MTAPDVVALAAMGVEARALRRHARPVPGVQVVEAGIALARRPLLPAGSDVVVCGLGGALSAELSPGTVFVADRLALPDGEMVEVDRGWVEALRDASSALGLRPVTGGLLTATSLVTGAERTRWAARGFLAVDMETAHLAGPERRVAGLRVILDTPAHELSPKWERPGRAALDPRLWRELAWILRCAPAYSDRAARVLMGAVVARAEVGLTTGRPPAGPQG